MANRHAPKIKLASIGLILIALLLLMRTLPLNELRTALESWISSLGVAGPIVYGLIYIVATIIMAPGWILTAGAGAIFGLWLGTIVVSIASTTAAALALLIGRYLARDKVAQMAQNNATFNAVDKAIAEGGWKIVALLRLSPAIPFNLQNYLYGLTSIRFWPCVLTSWITMLPGTFMYVYFGYLASSAVGDAQSGNQIAKWSQLGIGLVATVAVTMYITKLAKRKLQEQTGIASEKPPTESPQERSTMSQDTAASQGWPWGATTFAVVAVMMLSLAAYAQLNRDAISSLFGPPQVKAQETYQNQPDGPTFDHSAFDELLRQHVDADGWVDYEALTEDVSTLDTYIASLGSAPFDNLGRDEKLALLINAYNAFTLKLILDHQPLESIKDIPDKLRWDAQRWNIGGRTYSLSDIEHKQIRPNFAEPRIHFALVCAAVGCPPLRAEAFTAEQLDDQLTEQTAYVHAHKTWLQYKPGGNTILLTKLYNWYGGDFEAASDSVLDYVAGYVAALKQADTKPRIRWLDYDWKLNSVQNKDKFPR